MGNNISFKDSKQGNEWQRKFLRKKIVYFIDSMKKEQQQMAQTNRDSNFELIRSLKEEKVLQQNSWKDFTQILFKQIVDKHDTQVLEQSNDLADSMKVTFYQNRQKIYKRLLTVVKDLEIYVHEWQDKPFYQTYMMQSFILDGGHLQSNLIGSNIASSSLPTGAINKTLDDLNKTSPAFNLEFKKIPHPRHEISDKRDQALMMEISKQLTDGQKKLVFQKSSSSPNKLNILSSSIPESQSKFYMEPHPIKLIAYEFAKVMHEIYYPRLKKVKLQINLPSNKSIDEVRGGTVVQSKQKKLEELSEERLSTKYQRVASVIDTAESLIQETEDSLIQKATEEVKLFLECALILTQYFYRQSISLGFERLATIVVERITAMIFQASDRALFSYFLDLYKMQYMSEMQQLTKQFQKFQHITLKDLNVYFGIEQHNLEKEEPQARETLRNNEINEYYPKLEFSLEESKRVGSKIQRRNSTHLYSQALNQKFRQNHSPTNLKKAKKIRQLFSKPISIMKKLKTAKDPLQLIDYFMQIYQIIGDQFTSYKQYDQLKKMDNREMIFDAHNQDNLIQADDFVAILIYIIIKSQCVEILPYLDLISAFTLKKRQFSFEYMKASLLGSIEFITQNIDDYISIQNTSQATEEVKAQLSDQIKKNFTKFEKSSGDKESMKSFIQEAFEQFMHASIKMDIFNNTQNDTHQIETLTL